MIYTEYRIYIEKCTMIGFVNWKNIVVGKRYDDGAWEYVTGYAYGDKWIESKSWWYTSDKIKDSNGDQYYEAIPVFRTEVEIVDDYVYNDKEMLVLYIEDDDKYLVIEKNSDSMVFNPYRDTKQVLVLKSPQ